MNSLIANWGELEKILSGMTMCYTAPESISWKKSLHHNDFENVYSSVLDYFAACDDFLRRLSEFAAASDNGFDLSYRCKTEQSLRLKWDRNLDAGRPLRKVCNDIIGIRLVLDCPPSLLHDVSIAIDGYKTECINFYSTPKAQDDGYRGIHLYIYGTSFPVELQIWTRQDAVLHFYSHEAIYKLDNSNAGKSYSLALRNWMNEIPAPPESIRENFLEYLYSFIYQNMGGEST